MDEGRKTRIREWITQKAKADGCSWCGGHQFEVGEDLHFHDEQGGQIAALTAIECNQTYLFNTKIT